MPKHTPDEFIDAYFKEHPKEAKNCPFMNSSICGMTSRYRKRELPKGTVPKNLHKER